jgi:diguanylate cyclase (GGDEF)-like protein
MTAQRALSATSACALLVVVALCAANLLGSPVLGVEPLTVAVALSLVLGVVGVRVNRPAPTRAWLSFLAAMLLFLAGSLLRGAGAYMSVGERPLLPTLVTLSGYAMLVVGVLHLMRASSRALDIDGVLDAAIIATSVVVLMWTVLSREVFPEVDVPLAAALSLAAGPAMSVFVLSLVLYYAAGYGVRSISASNRFMVLGLGLLSVGDAAVTGFEAGMLDDVTWASTAFSLACMCLVLVVFHPSVKALPPAYTKRGPASTLRLLAVAAALVVPVSAVSVAGSVATERDRVVLGSFLVALLVMAAYKTVRSSSAQGAALAEVAQAHAEASHQAAHDALTGLPNRASAINALDAALVASRGGRGAAVMFLDLDRFKHVNDTYGHGVGDQLIVGVGQRLARTVRPGDTVARIGGDEFVVVMTDVDAGLAAKVAGRVNGALSEPFVFDDLELLTGSTLGVYVARGDEASGEALLEFADTALYRGKRGGRNQVVVFDESMGREHQRSALVEENLRGALERGELTMFFQPLVDHSASVVGAEALMRWESPVLGEVSPVEFISVAEDAGLVGDLGAWALAQACEQAAAWAAGGTPLRVSVNASARQLEVGGFADLVASELERTGLAGELLDVEITEGVLLSHSNSVEVTLDALRDLGVGVSLDDFGTGYSSLAYLKRFPVTRLKIDKSFVQGLGDPDGSDRALVSAVVAMAKALGLSVTAEGVETAAQAEELMGMGADLMQGYFFAEPGPAADVLGTGGTGG